MLFIAHEAFSYPFEAVPAAEEDQSADVFVEGENRPHRDKSPAEGYSQDKAAHYLHSPHHDDSDYDREIDVTGASE